MIEVKALNTVGLSWDFAHTQRMEKFIEGEIDTCKTLEIEEVIEVSGLLLKHEKIGNYLYDILLDLFGKDNSSARVKETLKQLVGTITIYDFVIEMRNVVANEDIYGNDILSALMRLSGLIIKAYNVGRLEGVISAEQKVVVSDMVDHLDLHLMFLVEMNKRPTLMRRIKSERQRLYGTDSKRYFKYLRAKDYHKLMDQLAGTTDKQLVEIANNAIASMPYAYTNSLFNEVDTYFYPDYDYLSTAGWQREETGDPDSSIIMYFKFLVDKLLPKELLRSRRFYVREKGVRIVFEKPLDGISHLELREVHNANKYDEHYINFFYTLTSGETRMLYICMKDLGKAQIPLLYEKDASVFFIVLAWLGLLDDMHISIDDMKKIIPVTDQEISDSNLLSVVININQWINRINTSLKNSDYYYETPSQWNYKIGGSSNITVNRVDKVARLIKVGRYTRRLPAGQKPSAQALALAKKFYIDLEEGYTLVDEFEKLQLVKK